MSNIGIIFLFLGAIVPVSLLIFFRIYRSSIVFTIVSIVFVMAIIPTCLAIILFEFGLIHLLWETPLMLGSLTFSFILINRSISKPIKTTVRILGSMSEGRFDRVAETQYMAKKNEVGALLSSVDKTAAKLTEIVGSINTVTSNLTSGGSQMSGSAQELSQGASEQASAVEEVSASLEQMNSSVRQNAENATQTEKIAVKAAKDADESGESVKETVAAMEQIASKILII
jgi:methyl-accepting chemotaxis protein